MLLTKFVPNSTIRRYSFCQKNLNYNAKYVYSIPSMYNGKSSHNTYKVHFLHHSRKFMQIRYHKADDGINLLSSLFLLSFTKTTIHIIDFVHQYSITFKFFCVSKLEKALLIFITGFNRII